MIRTWQRFHDEVRNKQSRLFTKLDSFPKAVLVAGCQRSGTTLLARLISMGSDFQNYRRKGEDDELIAALTLSGHHDLSGIGRFCFQTTYLNNKAEEYSDMLPDQRLVWVVRDPQSVVFSMLYNWDKFALNELFGQCGLAEIEPEMRDRFYARGYRAIPKLERAIYAHNGKLKQVFDLHVLLKERLLIVDYDELIREPLDQLTRIHRFIEAELDPNTLDSIHSNSVSKRHKLKARQQMAIQEKCEPLYRQAIALIGS